MEKSEGSWKKLKIELPYDLVILTLAIYPKKLKAASWRETCIPMFTAFPTTAKSGKQPKCFPRWKDKQNVTNTKWDKEGNSDTCYNMNDFWGHYGKWEKLVIKMINSVWFHLYEAPRVAKFLETESRGEAAV